MTNIDINTRRNQFFAAFLSKLFELTEDKVAHELFFRSYERDLALGKLDNYLDQGAFLAETDYHYSCEVIKPNNKNYAEIKRIYDENGLVEFDENGLCGYLLSEYNDCFLVSWV